MTTLLLITCAITLYMVESGYVSDNLILIPISNGSYASWDDANNFCQNNFATTLAWIATINDLKDITEFINNLQGDKKSIYAGFTKAQRDQGWKEQHPNASNWITADGSICPWNETDKYGYNLCTNLWRFDQPDNWYGMEYCAEYIVENDHPWWKAVNGANDISCTISYGHIYGFICRKPEYFAMNADEIKAMQFELGIMKENQIKGAHNQNGNMISNEKMTEITVSVEFIFISIVAILGCCVTIPLLGYFVLKSQTHGADNERMRTYTSSEFGRSHL